jgi:hypothetical protein
LAIGNLELPLELGIAGILTIELKLWRHGRSAHGELGLVEPRSRGQESARYAAPDSNRGLARVAETHERRLTDLEDGKAK